MRTLTYYQKPNKLKGTFQRKDNVNGGSPWNTDRYCELDHCMVKKQWMNSIINIQADPSTNINTDRKVFEIKIRQKLKARAQPKREPTLKGIKPEKDGKTREEAIEEYNSKFRELVEERMGDRGNGNRSTLQTYENSCYTPVQQAKNQGEKAGLRCQAQENHKRQENCNYET